MEKNKVSWWEKAIGLSIIGFGIGVILNNLLVGVGISLLVTGLLFENRDGLGLLQIYIDAFRGGANQR